MELLAPVGTIEALRAAVFAGADAVYFGLGELNARAKSIDFGKDNVKVWIDFCHLFGVKVYITINVNIYDSELKEALELVKVAQDSKADALIVSDLGLIKKIRENYPEICIHVSTQTGIKNKYAAEFYSSLGVTRVVLAREASIKDIQSIKGVEKEVFVHGALCVSFSGNCLLSSYIGGKSGNRGQCRQPCRQCYKAFDNDGKLINEGYLLSTKDVCLDSYIEELTSAGVDCLKIEGRLKSPEYVFAVTNYYRKLLDKQKANKRDVIIAFNRGGFTEAYFKSKNVIFSKTASHIGLPIGKVIKSENKNGFCFATVNCKVTKGDGLKILRNGIEVGGSDVTSCKQIGNNYIIPVSKGVLAGDTVCLTKSEELSKAVAQKSRKLDVNFSLDFKNSIATLIATSEKTSVEVSFDGVSDYRNLSYDEVLAQLTKTGNTDFVLSSLSFSGDGYLPKSALNSLRNQALEKLRIAIINNYTVAICENNISNSPRNIPNKIVGKIVETDILKNFDDAVAVVYYPKIVSTKEYLKAVDFYKENDKRLYIKFPFLVDTDEQMEYIRFAADNKVGVYADNVSIVELARRFSVGFIAGIGLNIANKLTANEYDDADAVIESVEIKDKSLLGVHTYSYGRIPLMYYEHCPNEVISGVGCEGCKNKARDITYSHKGDFKLRGVITKKRCYYTMYSDKKINLSISNGKCYVNLILDDYCPTFNGLIGE